MEQTKKISSVEWLSEIVSKMGYVPLEILEQAKAMHKEEIEKAHVRGEVTGFGRVTHPDFYADKTPEQYYNETYGGNNE